MARRFDLRIFGQMPGICMHNDSSIRWRQHPGSSMWRHYSTRGAQQHSATCGTSTFGSRAHRLHRIHGSGTPWPPGRDPKRAQATFPILEVRSPMAPLSGGKRLLVDRDQRTIPLWLELVLGTVAPSRKPWTHLESETDADYPLSNLSR